jgi:hypothetical protein
MEVGYCGRGGAGGLGGGGGGSAIGGEDGFDFAYFLGEGLGFICSVLGEREGVSEGILGLRWVMRGLREVQRRGDVVVI